MNKPFYSRQSLRKQPYDYSLQGPYFVTIVVHNKEKVLGEIKKGRMAPSAAGVITQQSWEELSSQFPSVTSEAFVLMPNHVHGILRINEGSSTTLGKLIRFFKGRSAKLIHDQNMKDFKWQRNYYDRIIRNDRELKLTQLYIVANPLLWRIDPENTGRAIHEFSGNTSIFKQCGFAVEDIELIKNYVEYRRLR